MHQQINCFWPAVQETSLHHNTVKFQDQNQLLQQLFFAYLKSITVSTIKKKKKQQHNLEEQGMKGEQPYRVSLILHFWML